MKRKVLLILIVGLLVGCGDYGWNDRTTIKLTDGSTIYCNGGVRFVSGVLFVGDYVECHVIENARFAKHTIYLPQILSLTRTESK